MDSHEILDGKTVRPIQIRLKTPEISISQKKSGQQIYELNLGSIGNSDKSLKVGWVLL